MTVTNPLGFTTSTPVHLTVLPPLPQIENIVRTGSTVHVSVQTMAGKHYTLERCPSVSNGQWLDLKQLPATAPCES